MVLVKQAARPTSPREQSNQWVRLDGELRLLCRGLRCSWCDQLTTVSTAIGMPGDAEFEQAIRALCQRLADEYGVRSMVRRDDDVWAIRFTRLAAAGLVQGEGVRQ